MKGYMTKYALSTGIQEVEIDTRDKDLTVPFMKGDYVYVRQEYSIQLCVGKDCFFDRESAVQAAKQMAVQRLKSLDKQIHKLQLLAITPKWK